MSEEEVRLCPEQKSASYFLFRSICRRISQPAHTNCRPIETSSRRLSSQVASSGDRASSIPDRTSTRATRPGLPPAKSAPRQLDSPERVT
jgi:hypothetical protein